MSQAKLDKIFTKDILNHLKNNKDEITPELLETLRSQGNKGKQIALNILDTPKDEENYYADAFNNRISYNGNRMIKKSYTKMKLHPIHIEEIKKCKEDIHYFLNNYVKIVTPRGINFPELRNYQTEFIDTINSENESIIGLLPRQSGKSITVAIYLSHCLLFLKDLNIGIAANKAGMAKEFLDKTKNIIINLPIWLQPGIKVWNKTFIEAENGMRILTDATSGDSFRGFTISILVVDECAFIKPNMWEEFKDSIFPSQSALAFKKNILISTANGLNHFYEIIKGARQKNNGYINYEVPWEEVPRYKVDGTLKLPKEFKDEIVAKFGIIYFQQNYGGDFMGSSYTLLQSDTLKSLSPIEPILIWDNKLNIYELPNKEHQYICSVDPSKDGKDAFTVNFIDITNFEFNQVAAATLQINYLLMPAFLDEWCKEYNNAYLIIENNEGAGQSVADQMYLTYEYSNLHFDKRTEAKRKSRKNYPGTRTTSKSRKQILSTIKTLIENNKLKINDKTTISEFFTFILINNKYQAEEGTHDDMIMGIALAFTIFNDTRNFEDMRKVCDTLFGEVENSEKQSTLDLITIGSFNDGTTENENYNSKPESYEEYLVNFDNSNDFDNSEFG